MSFDKRCFSAVNFTRGAAAVAVNTQTGRAAGLLQGAGTISGGVLFTHSGFIYVSTPPLFHLLSSSSSSSDRHHSSSASQRAAAAAAAGSCRQLSVQQQCVLCARASHAELRCERGRSLNLISIQKIRFILLTERETVCDLRWGEGRMCV
jgi:hypothetical protein